MITSVENYLSRLDRTDAEEDGASGRRALAKIDEAAGVDWLQRHLDYLTR